MKPQSPASREIVGTIVGARGGCVVVQLESGDEVLCRSLSRLHRPLGFFGIPIGRRAKIRMSSERKERMPLIVEVLAE